MKLFVLSLTLMLSFALGVKAQDETYMHHEQFPFIVVTPASVNTLPEFTDQEFYQYSTAVYFAVNKTDIRPDDPFFTLYREQILPMINNRHLQLRKVFIRGAASPEGPYENNMRLGCGRSEALLGKLLKELTFQYVDVDQEVSCITEDYGYLCLLMEQAGDPDYSLVKGIYDECGADELCCKEKLMAANGGKLWSRLLKEYFPKLRAARLILWFSEPDMQHSHLTAQGLQPVPELTWKEPADQSYLPVENQPLLFPTATRRHLIAARTNLVHDAFYMPGFGWAPSGNIQFEYYPLDGHYTYNIAMTWGTVRKWDSQQFWQVRDFQAELRRYFKGDGIFTGTYLGAYLNGDKYGIGLGPDKGWQGEGGGAGLTLGHTMPLNKKGSLRLEFMAAAGFFLTAYDPYVYGNPITGTKDGKYYYDYLGNASDFKKRNHIFTWLGPTNLGIQLTYDILYRKKRYSQQ